MNRQVKLSFCVLFALSMLVFPCYAGKILSSNLHGVIPSIEKIDFELTDELGCDAIRIDIQWGGVQLGGPDDWDWEVTDRLVGQAARHGFQVLATLAYSPWWVNQECVYDPECCKGTVWWCWQHRLAPEHLADYAYFVYRTVERYKQGGLFWENQVWPPGSTTGVSLWEVWNEPNLKYFWWMDHPNEMQSEVKYYARVLALACLSIEAAYDNTHLDQGDFYVMNGGWAPWGTRNAMKELYLDGFSGSPFDYDDRYKPYFDSLNISGFQTYSPDRTMKDYFNLVAFHPYVFTANDRYAFCNEIVDSITDVMSSNNDEGKCLINNEYGESANDWRDYVNPEKEKARENTYRLLQIRSKETEDFPILGNFIFRLRSDGSSKGPDALTALYYNDSKNSEKGVIETVAAKAYRTYIKRIANKEFKSMYTNIFGVRQYSFGTDCMRTSVFYYTNNGIAHPFNTNIANCSGKITVKAYKMTGEQLETSKWNWWRDSANNVKVSMSQLDKYPIYFVVNFLL